MNRLLSEAIMNYLYRRRLIVTHVRKLKRVHKLGQYLEVHKFVCVYLKIKPNYSSKGALYRKMMQYGVKLSTKHPSETNKNFENSYLFGKNRPFTIFQIRLRYFVNKIVLVLNIFPIFGLA